MKTKHYRVSRNYNYQQGIVRPGIGLLGVGTYNKRFRFDTSNVGKSLGIAMNQGLIQVVSYSMPGSMYLYLCDSSLVTLIAATANEDSAPSFEIQDGYLYLTASTIVGMVMSIG